MPLILNGSTGISGTDGSASTPAVQGTDTNTGLFFPAADTIAFAEGGTEVMRIDSAGNVGVGTPSPAYRLDVQGGATRVYRAGADALSAVENNSTFNSYTAYINSSGTFDVGKGNGVAFLAANGAQPLIVNTNASERMRIDASGNVGIGTTVGGPRLRVSAGGVVSAPVLGNVTNYPVFISNTDIAYGLGIGTHFGTGHVWLQAQRADGTAVAYNITLNEAGGNVGIGTSSPAARLDVNGSIIAGTANGVSMFVPVNSAIRDTASTGSTMFFDVATGGATHGAFNFRSSNSFTSRMVVASNGDLQFNSGYGSAATAYGCRAWVNFNGTGTVAIRASGNVSSISDNGTGDYTVNFATAMPDANYSVAGFASNNGDEDNETFTVSAGATTTYSTTALRVSTTESYGSVTSDTDSPRVSVVIFR